jgi:hypothetical protein
MRCIELDLAKPKFVFLLMILCCLNPLGATAQQDEQKQELFDMAAIKDPSTLDVDVRQPWHSVAGEVPTRQKLVTIHVGRVRSIGYLFD